MSEPVFQENVTCHAWNENHNLLAICPGSPDIFIYDTKGENPKKWKKKHVLSGHFMAVTDLDWNYNNNSIVSSGQDRNAYVWTCVENKWKPVLVVLRIGRAATCCKWSPSGVKFAVGSGSKQIPVCHYEESEDMWVARMIKKAGRSTILSVDWAPNNMFLIAAGSDFKCRIFAAYIKGVDSDCKLDDGYSEVFKESDVTSSKSFGNCLMEFDNAKGWIESCIFDKNSSKFAFVGHDSTISFGELKTNKQTTINNIQTIKRRSLPFTCVSFINDKIIVAAGYDGIPVVFVFENNKWIEKGNLDKGKTKSKSVKKKPKTAFGNAFAKFDQSSKLGKKETSEDNLPFRHQNVINKVIHWKGTQFTTSSDDGRVLYWDTTKKY